jgi:selenocysteine lyase/cysteine desulfurase
MGFLSQRICQMARSRDIETIVDGAHAFAHLPYLPIDLERRSHHS